MAPLAKILVESWLVSDLPFVQYVFERVGLLAKPHASRDVDRHVSFAEEEA
jgi:hypothetical protein